MAIVSGVHKLNHRLNDECSHCGKKIFRIEWTATYEGASEIESSDAELAAEELNPDEDIRLGTAKMRKLVVDDTEEVD